MLATQHSLQNSLRWTRRLLVFGLIIAHLMTVVLADAASAAPDLHLSALKAWNQQGSNLFTNDNFSTRMDETTMNDIGLHLASRKIGTPAP